MKKTFIALEFDIDDDAFVDKVDIQEVEEMLRRAVVVTIDDHCKRLTTASYIRLVGSAIGKRMLNYKENDPTVSGNLVKDCYHDQFRTGEKI